MSRTWALFFARGLIKVELDETLNDFFRVGGAHVTGDDVEFIVVDIKKKGLPVGDGGYTQHHMALRIIKEYGGCPERSTLSTFDHQDAILMVMMVLWTVGST